MKFNEDGYLPEGVHEMDWEAFYDAFGFSPKRKRLLEGMKNAITQLKRCGCAAIYIDGSFVTTKLEPNDYDACWDGNLNSVCSKMKDFEPVFLDIEYPRQTQKDKYGGEFLYKFDIYDSKGTSYYDFFQKIKFSNRKKGIVKIKL